MLTLGPIVLLALFGASCLLIGGAIGAAIGRRNALTAAFAAIADEPAPPPPPRAIAPVPPPAPPPPPKIIATAPAKPLATVPAKPVGPPAPPPRIVAIPQLKPTIRTRPELPAPRRSPAIVPRRSVSRADTDLDSSETAVTRLVAQPAR